MSSSLSVLLVYFSASPTAARWASPTAGRFELTLHLESTWSAAQLDSLFWDVATPGSQRYLNFLSLEDLASKVGSKDVVIAAATAFLQETLHGKVTHVSPLRHIITASFEPPDSEMRHLWTARGMPKAHLVPPGVDLVTRRDFGLLAPPPPAQRRRSHHDTPDGAYSVAAQKKAYQVPAALAATNPATTQMVWGPGTFGFSRDALRDFAREECPNLNVDKVLYDTAHHGVPGGDNFGEGTLDTHMTAAFGLNATTIVSNTNTSMSTEESDGFGLAMLDFITELAGRPQVPHVLSLSLGSLSAYSCDLLCSEAAKTGDVTLAECRSYLEKQRQVCMFQSTAQMDKINAALMALGLRGVSIFGSSGDGGSHWSFGPFEGFGKVPRTLNKVGCAFNFPIFPSPSPYMVSVGGTEWDGLDPTKPVMWRGSGGGFSWSAPMPSHQAAAVGNYLHATSGLPPPSSFNASGRAYPDIAAVAVDGTSQSSPVFAGLFTLLIDARLNAGLKPLGFVAPRIYQVAQAFPNEAFEDVTVGNSKTTCESGFPAAKGWDPTTGWGRPVWPGLVKHFASDDTL